MNTSFSDTFLSLIRSPGPAFISLQERSPSSAFGYFLMITIIYTVISILVFLVSGEGEAPLPVGNSPPESLVFLAGSLILVTLVSLFLGAAMVHLMVWIMDGAGDFKDTFRIFCYAETPSAVIGWIPVIGWIFGSVWSIILLILGVKAYHRLSITQSAIAVLLPVLVFFLILEGAVISLTMPPEV